MNIIHVNRAFIAANAKDGGDRPVFIVRAGRNGKSRYAKEVRILGPSQMVYNKKPLSCGAKAWIETDAEVELIEETTFKEVKELV